ncbi:MAG TPA: LysE family transporter [Ktedonobacterales bacterium]|jgi:threonine/homoserine/homoserine lactone efflux protein
MTGSLQLALTGVTLGLAYSAAPGVVNTEATRRGSARGFGAAFAVESGALIGDMLWAVLALAGVSLTARFWPIQVTLSLVGGLFLLRMAWLAAHDALYQRRVETRPVSGRGDFATGAVFGVANPVGLAFWSGLGGGVVASGATALGVAVFLAAFFLGALLWSAGFGGLVGWGRRWARPLVFQLLDAVCGLALGYFGFSLLWAGAQEASRRLGWVRAAVAR